MSPAPTPPARPHPAGTTTTRRQVFRTAGVAAGAVAGGSLLSVLGASPAAADHDPAATGTFEIFGNPVRQYDSRKDPADNPSQAATGRLSPGETRTVDLPVTDQDADIVAVLCNVTVVNTSTEGFLTLSPTGGSQSDTSAVNWFGDNQILANQLTFAVGGETGGVKSVDVYCGGRGGTDFIIDAFGYFVGAPEPSEGGGGLPTP